MAKKPAKSKKKKEEKIKLFPDINTLYRNGGDVTGTPSAAPAWTNFIGLGEQVGQNLLDMTMQEEHERVNAEKMTASGALSGVSAGAQLGLNPALMAATGGLSAPIGAVVGGLAGGATGLIKGKKAEKANYSNLMAERYHKEDGGYVGDVRYNEFNGPTHEEGGIQLGDKAEVEGGEVRVEDYIYSDHLVNDVTGNTFAEDAKKIKKKHEERPGDAISQKTLKIQLENLKKGNEVARKVKELQEQTEGMTALMKYGGCMKFEDGGYIIDEAQEDMFEMGAKERKQTKKEFMEYLLTASKKYGGEMYKHGGHLYQDGGPLATPKESYVPIDGSRPSYTDEEGKERSEYKITVEMDGQHYVLPTVIEGKQLSEDEAINYFKKTGEHMGKFGTPEEAEKASRLRTFMYNEHPAYAKRQDGGPLGDPPAGGGDGKIPYQIAIPATGETKTIMVTPEQASRLDQVTKTNKAIMAKNPTLMRAKGSGDIQAYQERAGSKVGGQEQGAGTYDVDSMFGEPYAIQKDPNYDPSKNPMLYAAGFQTKEDQMKYFEDAYSLWEELGKDESIGQLVSPDYSAGPRHIITGQRVQNQGTPSAPQPAGHTKGVQKFGETVDVGTQQSFTASTPEEEARLKELGLQYDAKTKSWVGGQSGQLSNIHQKSVSGAGGAAGQSYTTGGGASSTIALSEEELFRQKGAAAQGEMTGTMGIKKNGGYLEDGGNIPLDLLQYMTVPHTSEESVGAKGIHGQLITDFMGQDYTMGRNTTEQRLTPEEYAKVAGAGLEAGMPAAYSDALAASPFHKTEGSGTARQEASRTVTAAFQDGGDITQTLRQRGFDDADQFRTFYKDFLNPDYDFKGTDWGPLHDQALKELDAYWEDNPSMRLTGDLPSAPNPKASPIETAQGELVDPGKLGDMFNPAAEDDKKKLNIDEYDKALLTSLLPTVDKMFASPELESFDRADLKDIDLSEERDLIRREAAKAKAQARENVRGTAKSSAEALSALSTSGAAISDQEISNILRSRIDEKRTNLAQDTQEELTNTNISMQEAIANAQNRAAAESLKDMGLTELSTNVQAYMKDKKLDKVSEEQRLETMNIINQMFPNYKWGEDPDRDGKLILSFRKELDK